MTTRHPYFDLTLHTDAELTAVLGSAVTSRETLAEWPLSCVQRIRTADGRTRIYKAQAEPTVEPEFYAVARSPALPVVTQLPNPPGPPALLMEAVTAPRLCDLRIAPADAPRTADAVLATIAGIRSDPTATHGLPATADLSTRSGYDGYVESMLADLSALVESGMFAQTGPATVARIASVAVRVRNPVSMRNRVSPPGYLHGDLTAENVFVRDTTFVTGSFVVVDWQRPLRGPVDLDRACLLESLGADPSPVVGPEIIALLALTRIAWLSACARRWFPPGVPAYDTQIAALVETFDVG